MIEALLTKELYEQEFDRIKAKIKFDKVSFDDYEVNETVTAGWLLYNQDFVIREIIKTIKGKKYQSPIAVEKRVLIEDKERLLYGFDWHEKVLQGAVSSLLMKELEPVYSD